MILSASRRTDIPAWYFEWFLNRLKAGFALARNPLNPRQVSRVTLSPQTVDCIAFWTKNPAPMLERLDELSPYPYFVQFTINPYGPEMECNLPEKKVLLDTFRRLADIIGPQRVIWRYSPVLLDGNRYTENFHLEAFGRLSRSLAGYTERCRLSFLDLYAKIRKTMRAMDVVVGNSEQQSTLARGFAGLAAASGIEIGYCGQHELRDSGISPGSCIDGALVERIIGYPLNLKKDAGQRAECLCAASIDIGAYDTCQNGCRYCYANHSPAVARANYLAHDPEPPLLGGALSPEDRIHERKTSSNRQRQFKLE